MAQDGFALLKQVAAAHLGNAAVQVQLCTAMGNLAYNNDANQVHRPDGRARRGDDGGGMLVIGDSWMRCMCWRDVCWCRRSRVVFALMVVEAMSTLDFSLEFIVLVILFISFAGSRFV